MAEQHTIREVRESDLSALVGIEQKRWSREGTDILGIELLTQWYETQSPFFLVAEKNEEITGFYYGMQVHFSMDTIEEFTSADARTDQGYTKHTHDPSGISAYGVNVVTIAPEAGVALNQEVHRRLVAMKAPYFIGFTRLVHLDHYLRGVEATNGGKLPYPESEIALWYAHQTMKMIDARVWSQCSKEPDLDLPPLRRPDTILAFHVHHTRFGLVRVVPQYMEDPKSRNYGAFIVSDWPHVRD